MADFADLTELRNNLVLLFGDRISALDKKLLELSKSSVSSEANAADVRIKEILAETLKMQPTVPLEQKLIDADEKSIEQLHKEMLQALAATGASRDRQGLNWILRKCLVTLGPLQVVYVQRLLIYYYCHLSSIGICECFIAFAYYTVSLPVRILAVLHIERLVKHLKASGILQNF